ncbi:hypothetical protein Droror1_Dr00018635 [Drosera rotundifolia]
MHPPYFLFSPCYFLTRHSLHTKPQATASPPYSQPPPLSHWSLHRQPCRFRSRFSVSEACCSTPFPLSSLEGKKELEGSSAGLSCLWTPSSRGAKRNLIGTMASRAFVADDLSEMEVRYRRI